jgi:hypothetical protein
MTLKRKELQFRHLPRRRRPSKSPYQRERQLLKSSRRWKLRRSASGKKSKIWS